MMTDFFDYVLTLDPFQVLGLLVFGLLGLFLILMSWSVLFKLNPPYYLDRSIGFGALFVFIVFWYLFLTRVFWI